MTDSIKTKFGFALLLSLLLLLTASKSVLYDTLDPDCFWHLRVAEQLQRDGIHPLVDELSFSSIKDPWTPYSWLAELGMKAIWDTGGYRAAIAAQAITIAAMFYFLALTCLAMTDESRPYIGVGVAVTFGAYLSLPYLSFRPVTFALAIIAICAWLLTRDRARDEKTQEVWLVPALTALLINLHPFALFVPLWVAALLVGAMWEKRSISHWCERGEHARKIKRYSILLGLTAAACLATPMLGGTIRSILHYGGRDPMVAAGLIAELQPFYRGPLWYVTALVLLVAIGAMMWRRKDLRVAEWIVLAIGLIGLLRMGRLTPLFVLIAAPMLAAALPMLKGRLLAKPLVWCVILCALGLGAVRVIASFPSHETTLAQWLNRNGPETPGYPVDAAEFVATHVPGSSGKIINDFSWGGYLAWKLGPKYQVFMDPRTQLYTPHFWEKTCLGSLRDMQQSLAEVRADAAIVPITSKRLSDALLALNWREIYRDDRAAVLVPADSPVADTR